MRNYFEMRKLAIRMSNAVMDPIDYLQYFIFSDADEENNVSLTGIVKNANLTEITDKNNTITLPFSIEKGDKIYTVTSIGAYAFEGRRDIVNIRIPDSILSIGDYAFYNCKNIQTVFIGDGVTLIGKHAFSGHSKSSAALTSLNSSVRFGGNVETIDTAAFRYCKGISSVQLPDNLRTIGDYAFYECTGLISVVIGEGLKSSGTEAFRNCLINEVKISNISSWCDIDFADKFSNPAYIAKRLYLNDNLLTDLVIPNNVLNIKQHTFSYNYSLKSITIGDSVKDIGDYAFAYCKYIENVIISNSVLNIGASAFNSCYALETAKLGNSVDSIGEKAFYMCGKLVSINIPESVTNIGIDAFRYIGMYEQSGFWYSRGNQNNGYIELFCIGTWLIYVKNETSGDTVKIPSSYSYTNGKSDCIKNIATGAFETCDNLVKLGIPDTVTRICEYVCEYCKNLSEVYYEGLEESWNDIYIAPYNDYLINANIHYNAYNEI